MNTSGNILPGPGFGAQRPGVDYDELVRQFEESAEFMYYSKIGVECQAKNHKGFKHGVPVGRDPKSGAAIIGPANCIFACAHVLDQDEKHPQGITLMPMGFYLCNWCYRHYQDRKPDWSHTVMTTCWECIVTEIERIKQIDPAKYIDLLTTKR